MKCKIISFVLSFSLLFSCAKREFENPVDLKTTITEPQEFRAVQQGEFIKLTWEQNKEITGGYEIERKIESESFKQISKIENPTQTSYLDTTTRTQILYTYRIKGFSDKNSTDYSKSISFKAKFLPPTNLKSVPISDSQVRLTWKANNSFESGFRIERKEGNGNFVQIAELSVNMNSYEDSSLDWLTDYTYRVYAFTSANQSDFSNTSSINISKSVAPDNLQAQPINDSKIRLTWQDNTTFESGFRIERKESIGSFIQIAELSADVTSYEDSNLEWQTDYTYRIYAYTSANQSDFSNESSLNISNRAAPVDLQISPFVDGINLSWIDQGTFEDGFRIERKDNTSSWKQIADLPANNTSYTDTGLNVVETYTYRIYAYVSNKQSAYSNEVSGKIVLPLLDMVLVSGGAFTMGDTWGDGYSNELPTHQVTLSSFSISKYEVTQAQYLAVMGTNPSYFSGDNKPVEEVTWYDAVTFCNKLSRREGLTSAYAIIGANVSWDTTAHGYRLPTEAEWEYAARGGSQSQGYKYSGSDNSDAVAWYGSNSGGQTRVVGAKQANELGIFDMSGNVYEWCWDRYGGYTSNAQTNPTGHPAGRSRVLRGGNYNYTPYYTRVAFRYAYDPSYTRQTKGFRIARFF